VGKICICTAITGDLFYLFGIVLFVYFDVENLLREVCE